MFKTLWRLLEVNRAMLDSWGCRKCGIGGRISGRGYIRDKSMPWYKFWKKIECPNCLGSGNNVYPKSSANRDLRRKALKEVINNGESELFIGRNGKLYKWKYVNKEK